jgi:transposase-like protein
MNIMHTIASGTCTTPSRTKRFYSPDLKLQVVGACAQPGASIAGVAMQHGINANIVHRWLREHSQGTLINRLQTFVPVNLSAGTESAALPIGDICIEVKRAKIPVASKEGYFRRVGDREEVLTTQQLVQTMAAVPDHSAAITSLSETISVQSGEIAKLRGKRLT